MTLSELQCRNLIVKFCLQNPNKIKRETGEYFKLLGYKNSTIYRTNKRFAEDVNKIETETRFMSILFSINNYSNKSTL
jgi:hypothetical protein